MSDNDNVWRSTAVVASGIQPDTPVAGAVRERAGIIARTQQAEDAVLRPTDAGAWSHALRAAFAARIARLHGEHQLASIFLDGHGNSEVAGMADPEDRGSKHGLEVVLQFMDKVAVSPRNIVADDITNLQQAGIADADIVRLCELNAFLGYQIRLVAGLRLMATASPTSEPVA
ncbi:MAG: hypothetical protein KDG54_02940 [Geminicoccaceae bacterium]|nr:hypothetical protein [Geminicoccaceae bacterium]